MPLTWYSAQLSDQLVSSARPCLVLVSSIPRQDSQPSMTAPEPSPQIGDTSVRHRLPLYLPLSPSPPTDGGDNGRGSRLPTRAAGLFHTQPAPSTFSCRQKDAQYTSPSHTPHHG